MVVSIQKGRERLRYAFCYCFFFLLVSESPGGSEILVYTIYLGEKVMNQEPWTEARKHEHHRGAFTLAALGGAYHPSTAQHSYVCFQDSNHPLTMPRLFIQKVRCFHKSIKRSVTVSVLACVGLGRMLLAPVCSAQW